MLEVGNGRCKKITSRKQSIYLGFGVSGGLGVLQRVLQEAKHLPLLTKTVQEQSNKKMNKRRHAPLEEPTLNPKLYPFTWFLPALPEESFKLPEARATGVEGRGLGVSGPRDPKLPKEETPSAGTQAPS